MMAAVQPFLSGAISKTVNMPEEATVEDIEQIHIDAWQMGVKAIAIYRDNCKVAQPLSTMKKDSESGDDNTSSVGVAGADPVLAAKVAELEQMLAQTTTVVRTPVRERLPRKRRSSTFKFRVADCEGYVTVGEYADGRPGELFINVSKQGSTLAGIMDAFAVSISLGLQHGVPLVTFVSKYANTRFEPAGMTDDPELRIATSLLDYIFRRLALDYVPYDQRVDLGVLSTNERTQPTLPGMEETAPSTSSVTNAATAADAGMVDLTTMSAIDAPKAAPPAAPQAVTPPAPPAPPVVQTTISRQRPVDAPFCYSCGNEMNRAGSCYVCSACGTTSGCS
jgi:ribonucleoside-diphosphate reductase alpha chain